MLVHPQVSPVEDALVWRTLDRADNATAASAFATAAKAVHRSESQNEPMWNVAGADEIADALAGADLDNHGLR